MKVLRSVVRRPSHVHWISARESTVCLDRSYQVIELDSIKNERPDKRRYIIENFDCLRIDLTKDDKSMGIVTGSHAEKEISPLHKPEVVIIEGMAEKTFNMEMKSVMRKLGYYGLLENVRHGKGTALFIRNDKLKKKAHLPATVFAFTLRYPLV